MGNYRFRLSDMIPNAWFYKLKDMGRGKKHCNSPTFKKKSSSAPNNNNKSHISQPRYTYYFTSQPSKAEKCYFSSSISRKSSDSHISVSPRKSSTKRSKRKTIYKPSPKLFTSSSPPYFVDQPLCSPDYSSSPFKSSSSELDFLEPLVYESHKEEEEEEDFVVPNCSFDQQLASCCSSGNFKVSSSITDIIIDVNGESFKSNTKKIDGFDKISQVELPPILTKPTKFEAGLNSRGSFSVKIVKEERRFSTHKEQKKNKTRKSSSSTSSNSVGFRLRTNSPRIANRKIQASFARKSLSRNRALSQSFAVVKSSIDPQKDFKESMVEMIMENNIRASKDLEDLLACYLSLNSKEYHNIIIKAFEQIWFDMTELCL